MASRGLKKGDRCALLAHNGIPWVALDLALMAEGVIVVPLYARQAAAELVAMMKDCSPALICCGDAALRDGILQEWQQVPPQYLFDEIFSHAAASVNSLLSRGNAVRRGGIGRSSETKWRMNGPFASRSKLRRADFSYQANVPKRCRVGRQLD